MWNALPKNRSAVRVSKRKQALIAAYKRLLQRRAKRKQLEVTKVQIEFPPEEKKVLEFREWCKHVNLKLHPQLYIGRERSSHEIGVVAKEAIYPGEILAHIPRTAILTASTSCVSHVIKSDNDLCSHLPNTSSWVPLLIALIGEYAQKGSSHWQPYLNLVPNNRSSPPPMLWSKSERERLLSGTGVDGLIEQDLSRLQQDYQTIVLPFLQRHSNCINKCFHYQQLYTEAAAFVMSYSFTDADSSSPLSQTMMVPFADLLNHHTHHHVQLMYHKSHLEMVAIRKIHKGEEVMNTFGELPNYSLLHTHGFVETNNAVDAACVSSVYLKETYLSKNAEQWQYTKWQELEDKGLIDDIYEVDNTGKPEDDLLTIIQLAVVLQYMFLVTFMWMLMEGVVLYVALVRVFIKHPKRYIMCFTLLSYSIPGVYMLIIVPIGYLVGTDENHSHYLLYENDKLVVCWLNYESGFIWSFIIPVILILLVNIGFFIMSIVIMRRHQKTQLNKTKVDNIKYWLKSSISLTIVMGIGWLANVLFFTDKLLFISYIMTVFIAGQGIIIFILYVPLSKHVREAYSRWWRNQFLSKMKLSFSKSQTSVSGKNGVGSVPTGNIYGQYTLGTFDESTADILEKSTDPNKGNEHFL